MTQSFYSSIKKTFRKIVSILFPEKCIVCKKSEYSICEKCISAFPVSNFITQPWIHALFSYQSTDVRRVVYALKFKHTDSIAEHLAPHLHQLIQNVLSEAIKIDVGTTITLLPVPKARFHAHSQGFNAVLSLCEHIAKQKETQYFIENTAIARINTKAQVGLSKQERHKNMIGAFKVQKPQNLYKKTIFIIDDVTTTGSTLEELRAVCLAAGAEEVYAVTIAH